MADLGNVTVGIPANVEDNINITSPTIRNHTIYFNSITEADDIHIRGPIVVNQEIPIVSLPDSAGTHINIRPPFLVNQGVNFLQTMFNVVGDTVRNRPVFTINNRPQVSFFGSTLQEDLLRHGLWDMEQRGRVTGRVTKKGVNPVIRKLRLYHRDTGKLLSETWSDVDGYYTFETSVSLTVPYYVVCFNESNLDFNTIVHDWIVPEAS